MARDFQARFPKEYCGAMALLGLLGLSFRISVLGTAAMGAMGAMGSPSRLDLPASATGAE